MKKILIIIILPYNTLFNYIFWNRWKRKYLGILKKEL